MRYVVRTKCPFCGGYVSYGPYGQEYEWAESRTLNGVRTMCYAHSNCVKKALRKNRKKVTTCG